jgi:hypothetical protein
VYFIPTLSRHEPWVKGLLSVVREEK